MKNNFNADDWYIDESTPQNKESHASLDSITTSSSQNKECAMHPAKNGLRKVTIVCLLVSSIINAIVAFSIIGRFGIYNLKEVILQGVLSLGALCFGIGLARKNSQQLLYGAILFFAVALCVKALEKLWVL